MMMSAVYGKVRTKKECTHTQRNKEKTSPLLYTMLDLVCHTRLEK